MENVCDKYGLGRRGERGQESGGKGKEVYKDMLGKSSHPLEESIMYLASHSLLYCWVHKVF